jgi:predicted ATPase/DNA-binding SARP family transcriptional activator
VPRDVLIDELWGDEPPEHAAKTLQVYVSQVRKALAPERPIKTLPGGYLLEIEPDRVDGARFERLVAGASNALRRKEPREAADGLAEALALWRGPALADVQLAVSGRAEAGRLEELRVVALEEHIEAQLALGRHREVIAELEALVQRYPLRERLRGHLMLALYRCGRQADALARYRETRATFAEELGIEPSEELKRLERAILAHERDLTPEPISPRRPLPAPATPLVGRAAEMTEAAELLLRPDVRLVTLTGSPGIGKTRLALELAHALAPSFRDGAAFVALGAVADPAAIAPAAAAALEIDMHGPAEEALRRGLRDAELLLVLDNFEQLLAGADVVSTLLAASPGLTVLVTSRAVLRVLGEHELPVPPLSAASAVDLFVARAQAARHRFTLAEAEVPVVEAICARLDGLPLAIELAAARAKLLRPQAMLERLESRLDALGVGARDAPARQQTLRATMDWSYELLDPEDRRCFRRLGVFVGGFTLAAAEAVVGDDVLTGLADVVDRSLVQEREGRFGLLETVREYALERLDLDPESPSVRRRHALHYLALAVEAETEVEGPRQLEWLERLEVEHDNLRAAFAWALETGESETALRLVAGLWRFWLLRGYLSEGRSALEDAIAAADDRDTAALGKAFKAAGVLAGEQGDFASAEGHFERTVEVARNVGDASLAARAMANLGVIALSEGDEERARALYEEATAIHRELGDRHSLSVGTQNLGHIALAAGDVDNAVQLFERARDLAAELGEPGQLAATLRCLNRGLLMRGPDDLPPSLLREATELTLSVGDHHGVAECLETAAAVASARGNTLRAARLLGAADNLLWEIGASRHTDEATWVEELVSDARGALGDAAFAREYELGSSLSLRQAISDAYVMD